MMTVPQLGGGGDNNCGSNDDDCGKDDFGAATQKERMIRIILYKMIRKTRNISDGNEKEEGKVKGKNHKIGKEGEEWKEEKKTIKKKRKN